MPREFVAEGDAMSKFLPHEFFVILQLYLEAYKFVLLILKLNFFHCYSGGEMWCLIWIVLLKWLVFNNSNDKNLQIILCVMTVN